MNSNFENNYNKEKRNNKKELTDNDKRYSEDNVFFPVEAEKYLNVFRFLFIIIFILKNIV